MRRKKSCARPVLFGTWTVSLASAGLVAACGSGTNTVTVTTISTITVTAPTLSPRADSAVIAAYIRDLDTYRQTLLTNSAMTSCVPPHSDEPCASDIAAGVQAAQAAVTTLGARNVPASIAQLNQRARAAFTLARDGFRELGGPQNTTAYFTGKAQLDTAFGQLAQVAQELTAAS